MKRLIENKEIIDLVKRKKLDSKNVKEPQESKNKDYLPSQVLNQNKNENQNQKNSKLRIHKKAKHLKQLNFQSEVPIKKTQKNIDENSERKLQETSKRLSLYYQGIDQQKKKEEKLQQKLKEQQKELSQILFKAQGILKFKPLPNKQLKDLTVPLSPKLGKKNKIIEENISENKSLISKCELTKDQHL